MSNPYQPGTKSHGIASAILQAAALGAWLPRSVLMERYSCTYRTVAAVRERLREEGLIGYKAEYSRWPHRRRRGDTAHG